MARLELHEGETVLDLGAGGGIDVLLLARRVGPTGKAHGLDMTDEMLAPPAGRPKGERRERASSREPRRGPIVSRESVGHGLAPTTNSTTYVPAVTRRGPLEVQTRKPNSWPSESPSTFKKFTFASVISERWSFLWAR